MDSSGELDEGEMTDFLRVAVFVLHALGVLPVNLSDSQLHFLAKDMFLKADTDQGGTVDHREFYDWLQRSMHTSVVLESIGRATQQERKQRSMSGKKKLVWEKKKKKRSRSRSRSKSSSDHGGAMELDAQRQSSSVALLS